MGWRSVRLCNNYALGALELKVDPLLGRGGAHHEREHKTSGVGCATFTGGCLARPMDTIPDTLLGAWHGDSTVRLPIVFAPEPDDDPTDDMVLPVAIDITIHADGKVTGTVGAAALTDCVLKQNRGELGRWLKLATDYIVMDGYLAGPIVPEDETGEKAITIPFNLVDGRLRGSLFWGEAWKYPRPLLPQLELSKVE